MNKFGRRILAALITSSLVVTPVLAAPSVDDLQKSKASAQSEVNSLQRSEDTRLNSSHSAKSRMPSSA